MYGKKGILLFLQTKLLLQLEGTYFSPPLFFNINLNRWWGTWPAPPGHTFSNYGDQDPSRTDRMYSYSPDTKDSSLTICDISLFGDTSFVENGKKIYPSDHKGVAGYFLLKTSNKV
jgi:hypothetical protein